jgi:raffinose/stachyose/melibiose transport system permease protein
MNSFKTRNAIFGAPLSPPNAETFSLIGYARCCASRMSARIFEFADRHARQHGARAAVRRDGRLGAHRIRFRGSTRCASIMSIGIMVPIRLGSVAIVTMMRAAVSTTR